MIKRISLTLSSTIRADLSSSKPGTAVLMAIGDIPAIEQVVLSGGELSSPCKEWEEHFRTTGFVSLEKCLEHFAQRAQRLAISVCHNRYDGEGVPRMTLEFFDEKKIGLLCEIKLIYAIRKKAGMYCLNNIPREISI